MEAQSFFININRQTVQNPKYFVYKNKKYQVNFDLLKQNCTYFYQNQDKYLEEDNINIFDEEDEEFPLTEDSINSFIKICQNEGTEINPSSVIPLQYLSYKYEYPELKNNINELIIKHPQDLIFKRLLMEKKKSDKWTKYEEEFYDTSKEEEYISKHLNDFIRANEITELKMPVLLRILQKYLNDEENYMKVNNQDMIDFLFRCLDKYGITASVLYNKIDFGEEKINVIHRLLHQYQGRFDFNFLNSTLAKTTLQLTSESDRQKLEYSELFAEMKKKFQEQSEEIRKMKEEEKLKEIENEIKEKERKEEYEQRLLNMEKKYEQIYDKQKNLAENSFIQRFHKIVVEIMNDDAFYRLDTESQIYLVDEIVNKNKYHIEYEEENKIESMVQKILFFNQLFQNSSIKETNESLHELVNFILENAKILKLSNDICVNLYQKDLLAKSLLVICNSFDEFVISIEHPSESYEEISKIIHDLIEQNKKPSQQIQISVVNKQNDTFEEKFEIVQTNATPIESNSFKVGSSLTKIVIPTSVTTIESNLFKGCTSLEEIIIPTSVTTIEPNSFKGCSSLKEITIPTSITRIYESSFEACSSLTKISIPLSVTTIESNSFKGCSSLKEITIPTSITKICESSFEGCTSLTEIVIPLSVTTIESKTFKNCSLLDEITIPTSIIKICESSFEGCSSLTKIVIPLSVTTIESSLFKNCSSLKEITIPKSITKICESAFEGCSSLTEIVIPQSVSTIESNSFKKCINLKQITINPQTKVEQNSFDNCESFERLVISSSEINENDKMKEESSIFFNSNINSSFFNSLTQDEQETILKIIKVNQKKEKIEKINNIQTLHTYLKKEMKRSNNYDEKQKNSIIQIVQNDEQILIKSNMTEILNANQKLDKEEFLQHFNKFDCFFIEAKYKSSLFDTIYNKLKSMKNGSVKKLKIAVFITVCDQRFHNDKDINFITFDKCITNIQGDGNNGSFENCSSLTQVIIPTSVTQIGDRAFFGCSSLKQMTIPSSVKKIGKYAFYNCFSLTLITIPSSVTQIEDYAFGGCSSITQIIIPTSVTQIREYTFYCCRSLTQITIPTSVTQIGNDAFESCSSLKQVTIPTSVKQIGEYVFSGCSSLTQVTIPSSVTQIGNDAFNDCSSLAQITIPSSVTQIGSRAFYNCSSLTQITVPSSLDIRNIGIGSNVKVVKV